MSELKDRIAIILKSEGLSQSALAESLKCSPAYISQLCNGKRTLSNQTALLIEKEFGYRAEWLTTGEGEPCRVRPSEFKDRLEQMLNELGLKKKEFAAEVKISPQYITKLCAGERRMSPRMADLIEEKYGFRAEWLLDGKGDPRLFKDREVPTTHEFKARMEFMLKKLGMKKKELAEALEISPFYISKLCNGTRTMSKQTAALIEEKYGFSAKWLLTGKGEPCLFEPCVLKDRVEWLIKDSGLKKKDFADKFGFSRQFISQLCNGTRKLSLRAAMLIERELGYHSEWLLNGTGEPKKATDPESTRRTALIAKLAEYTDAEIDAALSFLSLVDKLGRLK